MKCLKCGVENRNDVKRCINCNTPMKWTPDSDIDQSVVTVKVSRIAITAIIIAICGLILSVTGIIAQRVPRPVNMISPVISQILFWSIVSGAVSLVMGLVSLVRIEISGGKRTGSVFAVGAIILSIIVGVLPIWRIAFVRTRSTVIRISCVTNLSGIGKAMLIYSNDYSNELPRAGGKGSTWGKSVSWDATTRQTAYSLNSNGTGGSATVSASLYLIVKYAELHPKCFICPEDRNVSEFMLPGTDLVTLWDFGPQPWNHISYSYNMSYGANSLNVSKTNPGTAIVADRNPWIPSTGWGVKNFAAFNPNGDRQSIMAGNTFSHNNEGQYVLYLDSHVGFMNTSSCGLNTDNIYTSWNSSDIRGTQPKFGSQPAGPNDSLLVNDPPK